jgi:hypothetical protein
MGCSHETFNIAMRAAEGATAATLLEQALSTMMAGRSPMTRAKSEDE